jgi:hypothetical protein
MEQQFPERIQFMAPSGFSAAMTILARRRGRTFSEAFRQIAMAALRKEGVSIDPTVPPPCSKAAKNSTAEAAG